MLNQWHLQAREGETGKYRNTFTEVKNEQKNAINESYNTHTSHTNDQLCK